MERSLEEILLDHAKQRYGAERIMFALFADGLYWRPVWGEEEEALIGNGTWFETIEGAISCLKD